MCMICTHMYMYVYMCKCMFVYLYICVNVYLYICIYVYMYICIYVYMYICIYVYMYICIYVYMCICIYVYMCICIYVYMYMCIYVHMYICIYVHMYICIYVYVYICIYMYICIYVYMYICIYVYMYRCIYVYMYICIYVYMYICAYVYMDMWIYFLDFDIYMCIDIHTFEGLCLAVGHEPTREGKGRWKSREEWWIDAGSLWQILPADEESGAVWGGILHNLWKQIHIESIYDTKYTVYIYFEGNREGVFLVQEYQWHKVWVASCPGRQNLAFFPPSCSHFVL